MNARGTESQHSARRTTAANEKTSDTLTRVSPRTGGRASRRSTGAPRLGRPRTETPESRRRRRVFDAETRHEIRERARRREEYRFLSIEVMRTLGCEFHVSRVRNHSFAVARFNFSSRINCARDNAKVFPVP